MRISLVDRTKTDLMGVQYRLDEDLRQLGIDQFMVEGFKDWGVVMHEGIEYYMASYTPPIIEDNEAI